MRRMVAVSPRAAVAGRSAAGVRSAAISSSGVRASVHTRGVSTHYPFQRWVVPRQSEEVERLLKQAAEQDDVISFAGGLPADDLFPRRALAEALERVMERHGREALQYQWSEGYGPLREQVAAILRGRGVEVGAGDLLITHGAQQALDLLARLFLRTGDPVAIESPAYTGAIQVLGLQRPRVIPLPRGEHGLDMERVRAAVREPRPNLLYLTPLGHNPTGSTLAPDVCEGLVELGHAHDAYVIEDDAYGAIQLDEARSPLRALHGAEERVIHVGTFSKVLSPGLRVGWVVAPPEVIEQLTRLKGMVDLQTNTLGQMALSAFLDEHSLDEHVARCLPRYRERRDAMLGALDQHMPAGVAWTRPATGFSLWVTLPDEVDVETLLARALAGGVAFEPGAPFYPVATRSRELRLSYANTATERIAEGVRRLGAVLRC